MLFHAFKSVRILNFCACICFLKLEAFDPFFKTCHRSQVVYGVLYHLYNTVTMENYLLQEFDGLKCMGFSLKMVWVMGYGRVMGFL